MTLYGQTMTRTGGIFAIGLASIVPFGILSIAITTRYLSPADYGHLAVLFAVGSVVTVFCGVGFLQGTMMTVYGIADDGDGGDADAFDASAEADIGLGGVAAKSEEQKRLLGSGLMIVIAMTTALCGLVAVIGGVLASVLFGGEWVVPVLWMSASAWAGGVWRMMHQVPRMERRATRWATLQWMRPAFVVVGVLAALSAGLGVNGVLMATAIGTIVATSFAFLVSRRSLRFAPRRGDATTIWKAGRAWVPLTIAVAMQTNASVLLLGVLATPTSVALFQVATRIAQLPTYFADGFITAWPAMERDPISLAAKDRRGVREYSALVFTLLALSTLGLLVIVSLFADALIHIAAPSYQDAAGLIPIVAAGGAAHVAFRGVFRATGFPNRRYWYTLLHLLWIAPYAGICALLIPIDASYGVAIAQVVAGLAVTVGFVSLDKRSAVPTPFQWQRLGVASLIAVACVAAVQLVPADGAFHAAFSILVLAVFPLLLLALRAVPRNEISIVKSIVGSVLPRRVSRKSARRRLASVPPREREAMLMVIGRDRDPEEAAIELGVSESVVLARAVRGLRHLIDESGKATPVDHVIGEYVAHTGTTIDRDVLAAHLWALGIDPLQLHVLDGAAGVVAKARYRPDRDLTVAS
jgi:O-antigen/teichoic acid export membrane protein